MEHIFKNQRTTDEIQGNRRQKGKEEWKEKRNKERERKGKTRTNRRGEASAIQSPQDVLQGSRSSLWDPARCILTREGWRSVRNVVRRDHKGISPNQHLQIHFLVCFFFYFFLVCWSSSVYFEGWTVYQVFERRSTLLLRYCACVFFVCIGLLTRSNDVSGDLPVIFVKYALVIF